MHEVNTYTSDLRRSFIISPVPKVHIKKSKINEGRVKQHYNFLKHFVGIE